MRRTLLNAGGLMVVLGVLVGAGTTGPVNTAIVAVPKLENDSYDWYARHAEVLELQKTLDPEIVMIGDSITHFWGGRPGKRANGPKAWKGAFGERRVLNMGFGWDRTQNVLWRLEHGEMDGVRPGWVFINIGTNNFSGTKNARANSPEEVAEAIGLICERVKAKSPTTKVVVMGVFPRGEKADNPYRGKIKQLNGLLEEMAKSSSWRFVDVGGKMLREDGTISREIMGDFCHPTEKGYAIWGEAVRGVVGEGR